MPKVHGPSSSAARLSDRTRCQCGIIHGSDDIHHEITQVGEQYSPHLTVLKEDIACNYKLSSKFELSCWPCCDVFEEGNGLEHSGN